MAVMIMSYYLPEKKGLDRNKNITEIGKMKKGRNINITDFDDITNLDGYKHKF